MNDETKDEFQAEMEALADDAQRRTAQLINTSGIEAAIDTRSLIGASTSADYYTLRGVLLAMYEAGKEGRA